MEGPRSKPVKKKPSHSSRPGSRPGELSSSLPLKKPASDGTLALGDDKTVVKPKERTRGDNKTLSAGRDLSGKLLQDVAKSLGRKWEQVALHLGLKNRDLDEIKKEKEDEYMRRRNMLRLWKRRSPGKATAQDLLRGLEDMKDLPEETRRLLKGTSLTEDTASMPVVDRCEEEDCSDSGEQSQGRQSSHSGTSLTEDIASMFLTDRHEEEDCSDSDASAEIDEDDKEDEGTSLTEDIASMFLTDRSEEEDGSDSDAIAEIDEDDEEDEGEQSQGRQSSQSGTSLTEDTANMPVVDRCEEEDSSDSGASAEIDEDDEDDEEEMHVKSQHEKCSAAQQSPEYVKVTPTEISKWRFKLPLKGKGTYECSATGLVFEVSEQALVRYSVLSWSEITEFIPDSWRPAGSIWNVDVVRNDSSVLKFIHFPHSLCLSGPEHELSFSVLVVKDGQASIESTVDFTASHGKWPVSSLCRVGPIIPSSLPVKHDGAVLVYKELTRKCRKDHILRVFLSLNNVSEIKAVVEQLLKTGKEWIEIDLTQGCNLEEKVYHLTSEPEGKIEPKNQKFTTAVLASKGFFVVRFSALERPPFKLSLMESDCDEPLWSATIREEDCKGKKRALPKLNQVANNRGRGEQSQGRKSSQSEEILRIRPKFVQRVTIQVLKGLLDDLYEREVVSLEEKDSLMEEWRSKADRARCLADMVIGKGEEASQKMIDSMKERDKHLCSTLGLFSSPSAAVAEL